MSAENPIPQPEQEKDQELASVFPQLPEGYIHTKTRLSQDLHLVPLAERQEEQVVEAVFQIHPTQQPT